MAIYMTIEDKIIDLSWNKKLEVLRTINGWSQEKAAEECNTSQKVYWKWENAKSYPKRFSRKSIAKAYRIYESEIFSESSF